MIKKISAIILTIALMLCVIPFSNLQAYAKPNSDKNIKLISENFDNATPFASQQNGVSYTAIKNGSVGYLYGENTLTAADSNSEAPVSFSLPTVTVQSGKKYTFSFEYYIVEPSQHKSDTVIGYHYNNSSGATVSDGYLNLNYLSVNQWNKKSYSITAADTSAGFKLYVYDSAKVLFDNIKLVDEDGNIIYSEDFESYFNANSSYFRWICDTEPLDEGGRYLENTQHSFQASAVKNQKIGLTLNSGSHTLTYDIMLVGDSDFHTYSAIKLIDTTTSKAICENYHDNVDFEIGKWYSFSKTATVSADNTLVHFRAYLYAGARVMLKNVQIDGASVDLSQLEGTMDKSVSSTESAMTYFDTLLQGEYSSSYLYVNIPASTEKNAASGIEIAMSDFSFEKLTRYKIDVTFKLLAKSDSDQVFALKENGDEDKAYYSGNSLTVGSEQTVTVDAKYLSTAGNLIQLYVYQGVEIIFTKIVVNNYYKTKVHSTITFDGNGYTFNSTNSNFNIRQDYTGTLEWDNQTNGVLMLDAPDSAIEYKFNKDNIGFDLESGEKYTLSFSYKELSSSISNPLLALMYNGGGQQFYDNGASTGWRDVSYTFTSTADWFGFHLYQGGTVAIDNLTVTKTVTAGTTGTGTANLSINNTTSVQDNWLGANAVAQGFIMTTYTDENIATELSRMSNMGLNMVRSYYDQSFSAVNTDGVISYNFNTTEMNNLCKWISALKDRNIKVALNMGWGLDSVISNNSTTAYDGTNPFATLEYGQRIEEYGKWIAASVDYLVNQKGFTNVEYLIMFTEPNEGENNYSNDTNWEAYVKLVHSADKYMKQSNVRDLVQMVGPNNAFNHKANRGSVVDDVKWWIREIDDVIDIYSFHWYAPNWPDQGGVYVTDDGNDYDYDNYEIYSIFFDLMQNTISQTGKEYWLDEFNFGNLSDRNVYKVDESQLAQTVISAMNEGVQNTLLWQLFEIKWPNRTKTEGEFENGIHKIGLAPSLTESDVPYQSYYAYSLLTKYLGDCGATVYAGTGADGVYTTMVANPDGSHSIAVVNTNSTQENINISLTSSLSGETLSRYLYDPETVAPDSNADIISSDKEISVDTSLTDTIPADSIVVYSSKADTPKEKVCSVSYDGNLFSFTNYADSRTVNQINYQSTIYSSSTSDLTQFRVIDKDNGSIKFVKTCMTDANNISGFYTIPVKAGVRYYLSFNADVVVSGSDTFGSFVVFPSEGSITDSYNMNEITNTDNGRIGKGKYVRDDINAWFIVSTDTTVVIRFAMPVDNGGAGSVTYSKINLSTVDTSGIVYSENSKFVTVGLPYGELCEPTREDYVFDGWYTEPVGGTKITADTIVENEENHTIYSHWIGASVSVNFETDVGTLDFSQKDVNYNSTYGTLPTPTVPDYYTFLGWYTQKSGGTKITADTPVTNKESHTLYAHIEKQMVKVNFNTKYGSLDFYEKSVEADACYGTLPTPVCPNYYVFLGWYTSETGGEKITASSSLISTSEHILYAHWENDSFKFTSDTNLVFDKENKFIYGVNVGTDNIDNFKSRFENTNVYFSFYNDVLATGTTVFLLDDNICTYETATLVIYGDVNCDGIYDGTDATLVSCIVNGMLTREQVGEAVYEAADCNHDGNVDELDIELLNQAGLLLQGIDQTLSEDELLELESYNEYLSLIDQNPTDEQSDETAENTTFNMLLSIIKEAMKFIYNLLIKVIN